MKILRSTLSKFLCMLLIVCTVVTPVASFAKPGDVAGLYYATDIVSVLNGSEISSINIGGQTLICAEDMLKYGFSVIWNGTERSLSIAAIAGKAVTAPAKLANKNNAKPGTTIGNYYETDIVTKLEGVPITSFNVGGVTYIHAEAMLDYGYTVIWDGTARKLYITSPSGSTPNPPSVDTDPLKVITQPSDKNVNSGATLNLTVKVSGGNTPYKYAWFFRNEDGVETRLSNSGSVSNATTASVKIEANGTAFSGEYWCVITDAKGRTATSNKADVNVKVNTTLTATISPQTSTVGIGKPITFAVSASGGTAPYTYEWHCNTYDTNKYDATLKHRTNALKIDSARTVDSGSYWCVVTDATGRSVETVKATLYVPENSMSEGGLYVYLRMPTMPVSIGSSATFTAEPSGGKAPYTYTWYTNSERTNNYDAILTNTGASLVIGSVTKYDAGQYWCMVRDADGSLYMTPRASLTVTDAATSGLTITSQPKTTTVANGEECIFDVQVTGGKAPYTYSWQRKQFGLIWTGIEESTISKPYGRYLFIKADSGEWTATEYLRCVITDANGKTITTDEFKINISDIKVSITPTTATKTEGDKLMINVSATGGTAPYKFLWYRSSKATGNFEVPFHDTAATSITIEKLKVDDTGEYWCVVTDATGKKSTSDKVSLTVTADSTDTFKITKHPESINIGSSAEVGEFKVSVQGGKAPYKYQWVCRIAYTGYVEFNHQVRTNVVSTSDTLRLVNNNATAEGQYWCVITDANGKTITSNKASLVWRSSIKTTFTSSSAVTANVDGKNITYVKLTSPTDASNLKFNLGITGGSGRYVWQLERSYDNTEFSSWEVVSSNYYTTTTSSLAITDDFGFDYAQRARAYRVKVTDSQTGSVGYSDIIYVTYPLYARYLVGNDYSQVQIGGGFGNLTYRWVKYDSNITNAQNIGAHTTASTSYEGRTSRLSGITNRRDNKGFVNEGEYLGYSRYICFVTDSIGNAVAVTEFNCGNISAETLYYSSFWESVWSSWYPTK